ncbi:hypothetical protein, partial [Lichenifustis flavocetrariae]
TSMANGTIQSFQGHHNQRDNLSTLPKNATTTLVFAPSVGAERQSGTGQASFTNADGTFSSAITPVQILLTTDTI